ncbi:hypothetical protein AVEN_141370-1 [Araneus ventricosus]|uniref:Histone-lysine N-methyltransferase SETMAR n=1 Tax=Araneus ventricosus TaxID=182803 RepID=A0A4Y2D0E0_ARAVE|nr:hypothetical protein AVEN_141370-1 [Araneus ventricosus]
MSRCVRKRIYFYSYPILQVEEKLFKMSRSENPCSFPTPFGMEELFKIRDVSENAFSHSLPYFGPDVAPSDFHLYLKLKEFLGGKRFGNDEELENAVTTWLNELATEEYDMGILQLVDKCDKCLNVGDDYVESEGSFRYATE